MQTRPQPRKPVLLPVLAALVAVAGLASPAAAADCPPQAGFTTPLASDLRYFGNVFDLDPDAPPTAADFSFLLPSTFPESGIDIDVRVYTARRGPTEPECIVELLAATVRLDLSDVVMPGDKWFHVPAFPELWKSVPLPVLPPDQRQQDLIFVGYGLDPQHIHQRHLFPAMDPVNRPPCDDDGDGHSASTGLECGVFQDRHVLAASSVFYDAVTDSMRQGMTVQWLVEPIDYHALPEDDETRRWLEIYDCLKDTHVSVHARPSTPPPA